MPKPAYLKTDSLHVAAAYIAGMVNGALAADKQVLLLLPGGSSIAVAATAYPLFADDHQQKLTMLLTDERYGDVGHPDSNWTQLAAAGVPVLDNPRAIPVLTGVSLEETVQRYDTILRDCFAVADVVIGMFGMGADGHTAGIIPGTPAVTAQSWVAGYEGADFIRITMTFEPIRKVHAALLSANGSTKLSQLQALQQDGPLTEQPAQILKTIPSLLVCSDVIGATL